MAKKPTAFSAGDKVKVRGRKGEHRISYAMLIPVPAIENGEFVLVEVEFYKFINGKETFYAYAKDIKQ